MNNKRRSASCRSSSTTKTRLIAWVTIISQLLFPLSVAPAWAADNFPDQLVSSNSNNQWTDYHSDREKQLANALVAGAGSMANGNQSNTASQLTHVAGQQAAAQLQSLLTPYGTARIQLGVDERFSLENSQFDLLLPFVDNKTQMAFSQFGVRHADSRTTLNIGFGQRHFLATQAPQMLGYNIFYDHEVTNNNRRLGLGAEWWRDHLKLSANGYLRLSQWHEAYKLKDHNERPANGFDLRAEGYFPTLPQLGVNVKYEQYFGKEVALFGQDKRQDDPAAVTAGLSYTPFPLMTFGVAHKQSTQNYHDTQLTFGLSYQIGVPWQKQMSSSAVAEKRLLAGSRQQLVERNNNIVLEYQEQNLIKLILPKILNGKSGDIIPLDVQVAAKHGIKRITFDDSALIDAGGKLIQSENSYQIQLPSLPVANVKPIQLSAVAYDNKGNRSDRAATTLNVDLGTIGELEISGKVDTNGAIANDESSNQLTFSVTDLSQQPISAQEVTFTASDSTAKIYIENPTSGEKEAAQKAITDEKGQVHISVTNISVGEIVITAKASGNKADQPIEFFADNGSAQILEGNLFADPEDVVVANGENFTTLIAVVTDGNKNPLADKKVTFSNKTGVKFFDISGTSNHEGKVTIKVSHTKAEVSIITAVVDGNERTVNVTFTPDPSTGQIAATNLTVDKDKNVVSDGAEFSTVSAIVTDANKNPLANQKVTFSSNNGAIFSNISGTSDHKGKVTVKVSHTKAEVSTITAKVDGNNETAPTIDIEFVADSSTAQITNTNLKVDKDIAVAGRQSIQVMAKVTDNNGNLLVNQPVNFTAIGGDAKLSAAEVITNENGIATTSLTNNKAVPTEVVAVVNGSKNPPSKVVNFIADITTAHIIIFNATNPEPSKPVTSNGTDYFKLDVLVKDANENPVSQQQVEFTATGNGEISFIGNNLTSDEGKVAAAITNNNTESLVITASVNNSSKEQTVAFSEKASRYYY